MDNKIKTCMHCPRAAMPNRDVCFDCDFGATSIAGAPLGNTYPIPESAFGLRPRPNLGIMGGIAASATLQGTVVGKPEAEPMSKRYPKYYKAIPKGMTELDIYAVCQMFPIEDPSGAINHARKKLLIPGTRTGGKSLYDDVKEARDTLTRWLELHNRRPA